MANSLISEPFAAVLRSGREGFNAQFAQARRQHPSLEGDAFSEFLVTCADPVMSAVAEARPDAVAETALIAYEIGLELVGQGLAGPRARQPIINEGWQRLLPAAARAVAAAPGRVIGAVCNALHHLGGTPDARPLQWLTEMRLLAPQVSADVDHFLKVGQVAAWRAGLAHFRAGALAVADTLPEALALLAVGASEGSSWGEVRAALHADPWFVPDSGENGLRVVGRAGAFRGFGGLFAQPPTVASDGQQFFVRSGEGCWLLTADAFGATFHRAGSGEFDRAGQRSSLPPELRISREGNTMTFRDLQLALPVTGPVTSTAANASTLALTTAHSHAILFVALSNDGSTAS